MMQVWHDFLDSLDSSGGHIVVLFIMIVVASIAYRHGFPKAEDLGEEAFGAMLLALKSVYSNRERKAVIDKPEIEPKA